MFKQHYLIHLCMDYILAIDQGTHASRALVFDQHGAIVAHAHAAVGLQLLSPTHIEQDAGQLLGSVETVIQRAVQQANVAIHHAALATQRSTLVAWDRNTGKPLAPAISWQDRRSGDELQPLLQYSERIHQLTGLPLSAHYLAGKMRWLLQHNTGVQAAYRNDSLILGPLASFLTFRLLREQPLLVDHSNAARSLLFDLHTCDWSDELLQLFGIARNILPQCAPIQHEYGHMWCQDIPLTCVCGDQNAAVHAHGRPTPDSVQINIGTGAFILQPQGKYLSVPPGLLAGIASSSGTDTHYLLEGTVNGAGAALSRLVANWPDVRVQTSLATWLADIQHPPLYINGVGGLGSPWWCEHIDSHFIPDDQDPAHQAVAVIESIVFLLQYNLEQFPLDTITRIHISGGLSNLDGLCQRIADLSRLPVIRTQDTEATARGLAWLSLQHPQPWPQQAEAKHFSPQHNPALRGRYTNFINELKRITGKLS